MARLKIINAGNVDKLVREVNKERLKNGSKNGDKIMFQWPSKKAYKDFVNSFR